MNIEVVSNKDSGLCNAMNKSLDFVKTPYFMFLCSDDILLPNCNHPFDHFLVSCTIDEPNWLARGFWKALECFIPSTWLA